MTPLWRAWHQRTLRPRLAALKLLVLDVDGVLTDGGLWFSADGQLQKRFDVRDGLGIKLLQQDGLTLAFLSGGQGGATEVRAKQLGIDHCLVGIKDKPRALAQLQTDLRISQQHTGFIGEAFKQIRSELPEGVALLGFAGAPWTVSSYMIEGNLKARKFSYVKEWLYRDPKDFFGALEMYGDATADYLIYQGKKGADMVQVFDTWLSEMPREIFLKWYRPQLNRIFDKVKKTGIKLVYFAKQSHHLLADFVDLNIDVLSVDHLTSLSDVDKITKGKFSLQGNLDPIILFSSPEVVRAETKKIVAEARNLSRPAIMNLGHGILPKTPVECVRAFVEEASRPWT